MGQPRSVSGKLVPAGARPSFVLICCTNHSLSDRRSSRSPLGLLLALFLLFIGQTGNVIGTSGYPFAFAREKNRT